MFLAIASTAMAETPLECAKKHQKADIVIFSKGEAKKGSDLEFGIERIAIYSTDFKVFFKKLGYEDEFVRYIDDTVDLGDSDWALKLVGGGAVVISLSKGMFIYIPSSNSAAMVSHDIDFEKGAESAKYIHMMQKIIN